MRHRLAAILPAYLLLQAVAYVSAYYVRFEFDPNRERLLLCWSTLPLVVMIKFASGLAWGEIRRSFRHVSVGDLLALAGSTATTLFVCWGLNGLFTDGILVPRSVLCIDAFLSLILVGSMRSGYRMAFEVMRPKLSRNLRQPTLIYGARPQSVAILRMLAATSPLKQPYQVVGFVTEEAGSHQSLIGGLKVHSLTGQKSWKDIQEQTGAMNLLIPGDIPGRVVRRLLGDCREQGIKVFVIPTVDDLVDGRFKLTIRDLTISDLLRREPNVLDQEAIAEYVTGKRVMVTGGAGSIGSELCRQILDLQPDKLLVYDQSEFGMFTLEREFATRSNQSVPAEYVVADVLDERMLSQVMNEFQPQLVFHAAAYKHVPLMEDNPQSAVTNNILGTKAVADAASNASVERFVLISTDKAVRPTSVMGASKLLAEKYVQALARTSETSFITVRFGNVLNSMGSVVPTFRKQIEEGGPVTVTHPEMERFFMTIPEAVQLVLQAGAIGPSGGILILDMGEPVKIVDLAKEMIMLSGMKHPDDIEIQFTGMRPGEKLYEELFYASESGAKKVHEKIYCGETLEGPPLVQIIRDIRFLEEHSAEGREAALQAFQNVVAQYADTEWVPSRLSKAA